MRGLASPSAMLDVLLDDAGFRRDVPSPRQLNPAAASSTIRPRDLPKSVFGAKSTCSVESANVFGILSSMPVATWASSLDKQKTDVVALAS